MIDVVRNAITKIVNRDTGSADSNSAIKKQLDATIKELETYFHALPKLADGLLSAFVLIAAVGWLTRQWTNSNIQSLITLLMIAAIAIQSLCVMLPALSFVGLKWIRRRFDHAVSGKVRMKRIGLK